MEPTYATFNTSFHFAIVENNEAAKSWNHLANNAHALRDDSRIFLLQIISNAIFESRSRTMPE